MTEELSKRELNYLAKIDPSYACIMVPPAKQEVLKTQTYSLKGHHIQIPSRSLFITEDGSIYVVMKKGKKVVEYASLKSLIETVKKAVIVENVPIP